jgi:caffeoyl-CoA O-methyltransferase
MGLVGRTFAVASLVGLVAGLSAAPEDRSKEGPLDERVKAFLADQQYSWRDMNVPARDGQFLHDLIVEHGYKRALEIGTSTGHSGIWIAWALSKTGGKLITVEIDAGRHKEALANFEKAGVARFVDARLADAHELVKQLPGPFDFVFSDADKDWYKQYFIDLAPKMAPGGCYTTHNVSMRGRGWGGGNRDYVDYLMSRPEFETSVETTRTSGIALSFRKRD